MPTGMSGFFGNTYGARAERGHDMKRLERAIGIFRKMRKTYKGDTTVYMTMNTDDVGEILGWLEELKEYRATSSPWMSLAHLCHLKKEYRATSSPWMSLAHLCHLKKEYRATSSPSDTER